MIEVNKIRSVKSLEDIQTLLKEFMANTIIPKLYVEEHGLTKEDYEEDKKQVKELLMNVERRLKTLKGKSVKV